MAALLTQEERREAGEWAESIDISRFEDATFRNWPIGRWCLWNLHGGLRVGTLDFSDPLTARRARDYALHCALIALSSERLLAEYKPDWALCYHGAMSYYRVFFELCRTAGVRTLTHERGYSDGSFILFDSLTAYEHNAVLQPAWSEHWAQVPLQEAQWRRVAEMFASREGGTGMNFQQIHRFQSDAVRAHRQLRLPQDAKVLLAIVSGDWEFGMFKSYGGLGVLWDTQLEWLEETARICMERGWHLVIRHHPLGAGKTTYPRASAFLGNLIRHQGQWGEHVRVVMPFENLSTYDLMRLAAGVVTQFSSGGAEAMARGVPAVCVAASAYRHMGMTWVRDPADYAAALDLTMTKGAPMDETGIRDAFRYAHFEFFTLGSILFNCVGIKNAYEPDFRLSSPAELLPGVDPVVDRVCDHLLTGTPLYPVPEGIPSSDTESKLNKELRASIVEQREAIAAKLTPVARPIVGVFFLGELPEEGGTEVEPPADWRCRHRELTLDRMALDAAGGIDAMRLTLGRTAKAGTSPYVYFHPEDVTLDESAISQAIDLIETPENNDKTGVLFGCYVLDRGASQAVDLEWNTATHPPKSDNLPPCGMHPLDKPMTVLGLVLWRRDKLADWLEKSLASHDNDAMWCQSMLASFLDESQFLNLAEPVVFIRPRDTPDSLLSRADALAGEGNLTAALDAALSFQRQFGFTHGLRRRMATWLCASQRRAEALALIKAEYHNGVPDAACWQMLARMLPELASKSPVYTDYAQAVDTVFDCKAPTEEQFLHEKVRSLPRDARILELGAGLGRATVALAYACVGTRRHIFSIDNFISNDDSMGRATSSYHQWRGNLRRWGLESHVTACPGSSQSVIRTLAEDEVFDFAVIGASHEYKDVLLDFELVWPHVKPGGWIAFRDVDVSRPGSWRVWEQTGRRLLTDQARSSTLACGRKPSDATWQTFEDEWSGHTVSVAKHYITTQENRRLGEAMLALMEGKVAADLEQVVKAAPTSIRQQFIDAESGAGDDPWLHHFLGLMLQESDPAAAQTHQQKAAALRKQHPQPIRPQ